MQNKPNFRKAKMNITSAITKDYENISPIRKCQNKPNQTQFQKPHPKSSASSHQRIHLFSHLLIHAKILQSFATFGNFSLQNLRFSFGNQCI